MAITTIGPSGLDPFSPTPSPAPEEAHELDRDDEKRELPPLPEGQGSHVDTSI